MMSEPLEVLPSQLPEVDPRNGYWSTFWSNFDVIVCINLTTRPDRKSKVTRLFQNLNIPARFYEVEPHSQSGECGCCESHLAVSRWAYDHNYRNALIFEDDLVLLNLPKRKHFEAISCFLNLPLRSDNTTLLPPLLVQPTTIDWDIFYFGLTPELFYGKTSRVPSFCTNIRKVQGTCAHAYAISRNFMRRMYNLTFDDLGIPIDQIYATNPRAYAIFPTVFWQSNSPSDISVKFKYVRGALWARKVFARTVTDYAFRVNIPLLFVTVSLFFLMFLALLTTAIRSNMLNKRVKLFRKNNTT